MIAVRFEKIAEEFFSGAVRVIDGCINEIAALLGK